MTVRTPIETRSRALPVWSVAITVVVFIAGGLYFAGNLAGENPPIAGPTGGGDITAQAMAIIGQAGCQVCHGDNLTGNIGPTLHNVKNGPGSDNLQALYTAHPDDWANLWIAGTDPAVADLNRNGMPQFGNTLSADQIATVVEYLKTLQ